MNIEQHRAAFESRMKEFHQDHSLEYENEWYRYTPTQKLWLTWQAAISSATQPSVPDGWRPVPVEMTTSMIDAYYGGPLGPSPKAVYAAILAAAPTLPTDRQDHPDTDLHRFMNAAAGEGFVLDSVDATDLYVRLFPKRYADAIGRIAGQAQQEKDHD